jgi:hypothetical protein
MRLIDCFVRNVTAKQMEMIFDEYRLFFAFEPVPLFDTTGFLCWHIKVAAKFYKGAKAKYPDKIYLYHHIPEAYKRDGKFPLHVFGSGGQIDDALDTEDETTICAFRINKDYAINTELKQAYKVDAGKLTQLTAEEMAEKSITFEEEVELAPVKELEKTK